MSKRIISVVLAALMVALMLPYSVFAASSTTIKNLYVGQPYKNNVDVIEGATGYSLSESSLPKGLSSNGYYRKKNDIISFYLDLEGTPTTAGTYEFTVKYKDSNGNVIKTVNYTAVVGSEAPFDYVVDSVKLRKWPNKNTGYCLGQAIDFTGIQVTATVSKNGEEIKRYDITDYCTYDHYFINTIDTGLIVTVYACVPTKSGKTTTYTVDTFQIYDFLESDPNAVIGLKVSTPPTKSTYEVGDKLETEGLVVTATMGDLKERTVLNEELTFENATFSEVGTQTVKVKYKDQETSFDVTVNEKTVVSSSSSSSAPEPVSSSSSSSVPEPVSSESVPEVVEPEPESVPEVVESEPEVIVDPEPESEPEIVEPAEDDEKEEKKSSGMPIWLIVVLGVVVVLAGAAVALFLIGRKKSEDDYE